MATLMVLYNTPSNPASFDAHYFSEHVPLAKKIPGLRSYEINKGPVSTPQGASPYHLVALLDFDSMESIKAAIASPEAQATAADLANFAQAGVQFLMFEKRRV